MEIGEFFVSLDLLVYLDVCIIFSIHIFIWNLESRLSSMIAIFAKNRCDEKTSSKEEAERHKTFRRQEFNNKVSKFDRAGAQSNECIPHIARNDKTKQFFSRKEEGFREKLVTRLCYIFEIYLQS